jgi:hypothetical protein
MAVSRFSSFRVYVKTSIKTAKVLMGLPENTPKDI